MACHGYFHRGRDPTLIDLDAQDVLRFERPITNPLVPVAVQVEHRLAEVLSNLVERVEKVVVNFGWLCMPEDHKAADLFAEPLQVRRHPIEIAGVSELPFLLVVNSPSNNVQPNEQNSAFHECKILFTNLLTVDGQAVFPALIELHEVLIPVRPCLSRIDTVIPFVIARNDEYRCGGLTQHPGHLLVDRLSTERQSSFDIPNVNHKLGIIRHVGNLLRKKNILSGCVRHIAHCIESHADVVGSL